MGFYLGVLILIIWPRFAVPPRWQVGTLALWIAIGLMPPIIRAATRSGLECSFVAVGHGECVVLQGPRGETLLYDAGSLGAPEYATPSARILA